MRLNFVSETIWAAKIIAMNRKIPAILLETLESYYEKKRHWLILILDSWPKMSKNTRERNEIAKFYDSMMFRSWQFALSCTWWEKYASEKKNEIFEIKSEIGMVVWCFERYEVLWHFNMHNMRSTFDVLHISCAL